MKRILIGIAASLLTTLTCMPASAQFDSGYTVSEEPWISSRILLDSRPAEARTYVRSMEFGTIFLRRSGFSDVVIAQNENGDELLNASDMSSDLSGGIQFKYAFLNISNYRPIDLAFEMFYINEFAARNTVEDETGVSSIFFNGVPVAPPTAQTFEHLSDLQNYELNLRRRAGRLHFLAGVRHFKTKESYDVFHSGTGNFNRVGNFSTTTNELVGFQVGAGATLWKNDFFDAYATLKYAFMNNSVDGRAEVEDAVGDPLTIDFDDDRSTRLWDLEIGGFASIGQCFGIKAGYRGILAEDIATATDQSGSLDIFSGDGGIVYSSPEWHGFFLSLEGVF